MTTNRQLAYDAYEARAKEGGGILSAIDAALDAMGGGEAPGLQVACELDRAKEAGADEAASAIAAWLEDTAAQLQRKARGPRGYLGIAHAIRNGDWKKGGEHE